MSLANNQVFATESIYDKLGKQTLTTLPAPINSSSFVYRYRFATSTTNQKYSWTDFDQPITGNNLAGEVNNPNPVANNGQGTLGWYYSSANTMEPNTPTTNYPYARTYTPPGPDPATSKGTGPGDAYKTGGGHETQTARSLITLDELSTYYNLRPYFNTSTPYQTAATTIYNIPSNIYTPQFPAYGGATKTSYRNFSCTTTSGNPGVYPINGTILVSPGATYNFQVMASKSDVGIPQLHVTDGAGNDIAWGPALPMSGGLPVQVTMTFTVPAGVNMIQLGLQWRNPTGSFQFNIDNAMLQKQTPLIGYKIITTDPDGKMTASFVDAGGNAIASALVTSVSGTPPNQTAVYDNTTWNYNFYNDIGQLVASVDPNGVVIGSTIKPKFLTTYKYDQFGRLISSKSPDGGVSLFVYSTDGKIRFSQNNEQRTADPNHKRFSYTNYDYLGRMIESGEYKFASTGDFAFDSVDVASKDPNSILNLIDNVGYASVTRRGHNSTADRYSDTTFIDYDYPTTFPPADNFVSDGIHKKQNNLVGQIVRTKNANATTWYSYDEFGQVEWTVQNIAGLGSKTIDYTYDFLGNVLRVAYQKKQSDAFYHHYTYDADSKLVNVSTSLDSVTKTTRANYYYYLHGPIKRVELGTNQQGIDYVYNVDGSLKAINHPDPLQDPGTDGFSGVHSGFLRDAFGMALDYYSNDYTGANLNTFGNLNPSGTTDQFGGLIKSQRWHTQAGNQAQVAYAFNYDNQNRFSAANFGSVTGVAGSYSFTASPSLQYKEAVGGYDNNGNISSLSRNNKAGTVIGNYTYNYTANKNQLASITGNTTVNYLYNTIGQMTQQTEGSNTMIVGYNAYGLTKEVRDGNNNVQEQYFYDDRGDLVKKVTPLPSTVGTGTRTTYYVYDASGNILATYEQNGGNAVALVEQPIYGSGRIGMMKPKSGVKRYFYEVNDHLGNVRAVIGPRTMDLVTANYEIANANLEQSQFLRTDDARKINATLFNHTSGGSYSQRLSGSANEKYGLARSIAVNPGDTITAKVYAKYVDTNSANWTAALNTLMGQIAAHTAGVVVDGTNYNQSDASFPFPNLVDKTGSTGGPKAFLTWLIFDRNFVLTNGGYTRLSSAPKEDGQNVAHELMVSPTISITEPGYMYIYISNENDTPVDVYFDDFQVTQTHSTIVAGGDYYPFGMTINERQISQERYRYGYQGRYSEFDSLTKTNTFQLRLYDPRFGRWLSPDPYGQFSSPYVGMGNNPANGVDPNGGIFGLGAVASGMIIGGALGTAMGLIVDPDHWYYYTAGGIGLGALGGKIYDDNFGLEVPGLRRYGKLKGGGRSMSGSGTSNVVPPAKVGLINPSFIRPLIEKAIQPPPASINIQGPPTDLMLNPSGGTIREQDGFGSGAYGAPRDGGTRTHLGIDITTTVGQDIIAPEDGTITYFQDHSGLDIDRAPNLRVKKIRILYVNKPAGLAYGVAYQVRAGSVIGTAANLSNLGYPSGITPHVHVQLRAGGRWINPTPYFFP
jgi:RHS repeat-associated protein